MEESKPTSEEAEVVPGPGAEIETVPTESAEGAEGAEGADAQPASLHDQIVAAIETCYDPEIPVNIYELGLIYKIDVNDDHDVAIDMTLTSPACPAAGSLPPEVESKVGAVEGVSSVKVEVVWEPTWTPEKMTEAAKLQLGMF